MVIDIGLADYLPSRQGYIIGIARRHGLSIDDAKDIFQEVSLKLLEKLNTFKGNSRLDTFVYRIATNEILMHLRKKKAAYLPLQLVPDRQTIEEEYASIEELCYVKGSAKSILGRTDYQTFKAEVEFLYSQGRLAPIAGLAEMLNVSKSAARSRRFRMLHNLKKFSNLERAFFSYM